MELADRNAFAFLRWSAAAAVSSTINGASRRACNVGQDRATATGSQSPCRKIL